LVNPRGLNFAPGGELYVAEAGSGGAGPCYLSGAGVEVCYGPTGAVTEITLGDIPTKVRVLEGLPSVAPNTGAGATGPHDVEFQGLGNGFVTIGLGTDPENRTLNGDYPAFATVGLQFGRLVRFQPNGTWSFAEDLAGYEGEENPDGNLPDSNPYGLAALPGRQVYTDAGGNALNQVAANGRISTLAVFPNRGTMQAVPTSVAVGPDGNFYVGQLTGFPFPLNGANVYRVPARGGTPVVVASNFTKIIDLAFGPDGSLYVLQISSTGGPPPQGGTGSLYRIAPDGTRSTIVAPNSGLVAPGGVVIAADGSIYVTNFSVQPNGAGTVVKVIQ
jgi:sugar lactone lactonase YvrE